MSNELTNPQAPSETRSLAVSLKDAIPSWIEPGELDSCFPHGFGRPIPAGAGTDLRAAAAMHQVALAPATSAERQQVLLGLRNATIIRREGEVEAAASLDLLRVHLEDVPLDILQIACRNYCNAPGQRFFPRSAGELRSFINPLLHARKGRAFRLQWLAKRADEEDAERQRLAEGFADPADLAALSSWLAERDALARGLPAAQPRVPTFGYSKSQPTLDDYRELCASEEDALAAWDADQKVRNAAAHPQAKAA